MPKGAADATMKAINETPCRAYCVNGGGAGSGMLCVKSSGVGQRGTGVKSFTGNGLRRYLVAKLCRRVRMYAAEACGIHCVRRPTKLHPVRRKRITMAEAEEPVVPPAPEPPASPAPKKVDPASTSYVLDLIKEPFEEEAFRKATAAHLAAVASKYGVNDYTILYLLDAQDELSSWHSNRIYIAASAAKRERPILLILQNLGGSIEAGYLISKTCKRLANDKFIVAVPRKAKSAATLLALGADEVHMGLMSELGPIDPQFGGFPALGMKNALAILADLACKHPGAAPMLGEYLQSKLDLRILGYFERINDSAIQYAERLLAGKTLPSGQSPKSLADHFVNHYKDHGFVIDFDESKELLGDVVVKHETKEYAFANAVYESFDFIRLVLDVVLSKDLDLVGRSVGAVRVFNRKKDA